MTSSSSIGGSSADPRRRRRRRLEAPAASVALLAALVRRAVPEVAARPPAAELGATAASRPPAAVSGRSGPPAAVSGRSGAASRPPAGARWERQLLAPRVPVPPPRTRRARRWARPAKTMTEAAAVVSRGALHSLGWAGSRSRWRPSLSAGADERD